MTDDPITDTNAMIRRDIARQVVSGDDAPEFRGLQNILGGTATLHSLKPPPDSTDFKSREAFAVAYRSWWVEQHCWKASKEKP